MPERDLESALAEVTGVVDSLSAVRSGEGELSERIERITRRANMAAINLGVTVRKDGSPTSEEIDLIADQLREQYRDIQTIAEQVDSEMTAEALESAQAAKQHLANHGASSRECR